MLCVKDAFGLLNVNLGRALLLPRQADDHVEIIAYHRAFSRHWRHGLELVQLFHGLFPHDLRQILFLQSLLQFAVVIRDMAHLLLDFLDFFTEIVVALVVSHPLAHFDLDGFFQLVDLNFTAEQFQQTAETLRQRNGLQQRLLFVRMELDMSANQVGQAGRILHHRHGLDDLGRHLLSADLGVLIKHPAQLAAEERQLRPVGFRVRPLLDISAEELPSLYISGLHRPPLAFDEGLDRAVRQPEELNDHCQYPTGMKVGGMRIINACLTLSDEKDQGMLLHRLFKGADRAFAAHDQRGDHAGEEDNVPQGHHRITEQVQFRHGSRCC